LNYKRCNNIVTISEIWNYKKSVTTPSRRSCNQTLAPPTTLQVISYNCMNRGGERGPVAGGGGSPLVPCSSMGMEPGELETGSPMVRGINLCMTQIGSWWRRPLAGDTPTSTWPQPGATTWSPLLPPRRRQCSRAAAMESHPYCPASCSTQRRFSVVATSWSRSTTCDRPLHAAGGRDPA
jgi:hypothetical protein